MRYKDDIGIWYTMNDGNRARIVGGVSYKLTIEWEDGSRREGVNYGSFKKGSVAKGKRIQGKEWLDSVMDGKYYKMSDGNLAKIVGGSSNNLTIEWEDGSKRDGVYYCAFRKGNLAKEAQLRGDKWLDSVKDKYQVMKNGMLAKIIGGTATNATVEWKDGSRREGMKYRDFKIGEIGHSTLSIKGGGVVKGSTLKTFDIYKIAFKNKLSRDVYYECKCRECGGDGIMTPHEMIMHKCK